MGVVRTRSSAFAVLLVLSTAGLGQSVPPRFTLQWDALAAHVVERLDLQPGEQFLAVAHPGVFDELIPHLRYEVMKTGAIDLGVIDVLAEPVPADWSEDVLREGGLAARGALSEMLRSVDASIVLPGTNPSHPVYAALQDILRTQRGRTVHFHWLQNGSAFPLPGQPLPPAHIIEATYQQALLGTDYQALAAHQRRFEQSMRAGEVRVTNPAGTDIRFRIGDRPVNFQDGDASAPRAGRGVVLIDREIELPAGALRVAPLEQTAPSRFLPRNGPTMLSLASS